MTEIDPTAPASAVAAQVPIESPSPQAADPAKDLPLAGASDKSATSAPPKTEDLEKPKARASERIAELTARSKHNEARAIVAERRAAQVATELNDLRGRFADMSLEQQEMARVQAAVKAETQGALNREAEDARHEIEVTQRETFNEKVSAALERMPDFWAKFNQIPLSDVAAELIVKSDKTAEVAYWLASNPDAAHRIRSLPPHLQGAEIARIEARLSPAADVRRVSQAPAPVPTLGGGMSSAQKDPKDMPPDEYIKWRRAGGG